MTIKILENNHFPFEVEKIFQIFNLEESDSIRLVGGCVRDLFLQKQIKDFDFACKFLPEKIIEILEKNNIRAVPTGIKYGTITAVINHKNFEITTLRKDVENDGRYPKTEFVDDYFLDASRRDFTINALYLDEEGKIYDYFDGIPDLQNQKVKFIGDANLRINEDFLRIFRFFRFSCFYAKNLDNQGFQACVKNKNGIKTLSSDRIRIEFFKTLESDDDKKLLEILTAIKDTKIADEISLYDLEISDLENILNLARSLKIRLSSHIKFAFLILNQHKNLQEIFSRFNFSNDEKKYFSFLFSAKKSLKKLLVSQEKNWVYDFYLLRFVDDLNVDIAKIKSDLDYIKNFQMPIFPLNGEDFIALGFFGKEVGDLLTKARNIWIEKDFNGDRIELLKLVLGNKYDVEK